jgi:hypothetical protein
MLEVEAIGDGVAQGRPLGRLVAQPQTMKVFKLSLRSRDHLDSDEGDDLLGKTVPSAAGSHPFDRLNGVALRESGREVEGKVMQVWMKSYLLPRCLCVYRGGRCCERRFKGRFCRCGFMTLPLALP